MEVPFSFHFKISKWMGNYSPSTWAGSGEHFLQKEEGSLPSGGFKLRPSPSGQHTFLPSLRCWALCFSLLPLHQCPFSTLLFSQMSSLTHLTMQLRACNWWKTLVKLVGCKTAELGAGGKVRAEESSLRPPGAAMTFSHTLSNLSELASLLPGNARSQLIAESCVGIV